MSAVREQVVDYILEQEEQEWRSTYSSMLQFGLGGGLTFALGGSKTTKPPPATVPQ
jgi:hypothetical protein